MKKEKLKPCPFCGGEEGDDRDHDTGFLAIDVMDDGPDQCRYYVQCGNSSGEFPNSPYLCTGCGPFAWSRAGAKAAWNRRAPKDGDA